MGKRPTAAWILSLACGVVVVLLASLTSVQNVFFLPTVISGVILLFGGAMLYLRPNNHYLWSSLVIIVAVANLAGIVYILFAPGVGGAIALLGVLVPLIALIGGIAGLAWKPAEMRVQPASAT